MDKNVDSRIYKNLRQRQPSLEKQAIVFTRVIKLNAVKRENSYCKWGNLLFESNQYEKSLFLFRKASIIDPNKTSPIYQRAKAFIMIGKYNQGLVCLQEYLKLFPNTESAHRLLVKALQEQNRLNELEAFYQKTVTNSLAPEWLDILYCRAAESLVEINRHSLALEFYKKVDLLPSAYQEDYAMLLYHERQFEEAIMVFECFIEKGSTHKQYYNNITFLNYLAGRVEKALEGLGYILANDLNSSATYSNIILVLYHLNEDEDEILVYKDRLQRKIGSDREKLQKMYQQEIELTQMSLDKESDEKVKQFNVQKVKSLNFVIDLISNI